MQTKISANQKIHTDAISKLLNKTNSKHKLTEHVGAKGENKQVCKQLNKCRKHESSHLLELIQNKLLEYESTITDSHDAREVIVERNQQNQHVSGSQSRK